ncbi:hypothetical protein GCM10023199_57460 [Actinomycetospora chibensis]
MTRYAENPAAVWSSEAEDEGDELLTALLASARGIAGARRVADALPLVAHGAVAMVPDVRDAGVAVRAHRGLLACGGHTTETAARVDQAQIGMGEGPCIDAVAGADTVILSNAGDRDAVAAVRPGGGPPRRAGQRVGASDERLSGGCAEPARDATRPRRPLGAETDPTVCSVVRRTRLARSRRHRPGGEPGEGSRPA